MELKAYVETTKGIMILDWAVGSPEQLIVFAQRVAGAWVRNGGELVEFGVRMFPTDRENMVEKILKI